MEETELSKRLNVIYQPHPVAPAKGRTGMVAVLDGKTSVRDILLGLGVDPYQPVTIQIDGKLIPVDEWDTTFPEQSQLISIHGTVQGGGGGSNTLQIVALIAVVVVATAISGGALGPAGLGLFGSSFAAGGFGALAAGAVVAIGGSLLIGALFAPKSPTMPNALPQVSPTYSLAGGQNRARPYEPMPVVMGTHRLFFDYAARPFTEYRGNDQYLYQIFNLGLGSLSATDAKIGTTLLTEFSDAEFVAPDATGRLPNFPGNVDSAAGAALTQSGGAVVRTTSIDTYQIGIDLESTLFFGNDQGGLDARTVEIQLEFKGAAQATYLEPTAVTIFGDNYSYSNGIITVTAASQRPNRATIFIKDLIPSTYDVRLTRLTPDSTEAREQTTTNWSTLKSYQLDEADYKGQNRLGLIIKATEQLNGVVQQLSATVSARATYWNGSAFVTDFTSNPAHWFMHFARGVYNADGKLMYGIGLADSQIDFDSLHAWAQFCAAEGLTFNAVIDSTITAAEVLTMFGTAGFGSPSWASGKLGVIFDARNASPVMVFGMSNIIRDSFEVAYLSENLADEIVVRFNDPAKDFEQNEVRVLTPDTVTPTRTSSLDLFGCTSEAMAGKFANYVAAQQFYRRRRVTWQSDFEGFVCQRGDVVLMSHDLTQWGYSGRFVEVNNNVVTLDRSVPRQNQIEYLMLIRPNGTTTTYDVAPSTEEESDTLTIVDDFFTLQEGANLIDHRWTFSPLETSGKKLKILSVAPASDSRLQIVATDEFEEFYDAWDGTFVAPPVQTVLPAQPIEVRNLTATSRVAFVNGFLTNRVTLNWGVTGSVLYSRVRIFLDGNLIQEIPEAIVPSIETDIAGAGAYFAEVTPFGITGAGLTQTTALTLSALDFPPPPATVTLEVGENSQSATFKWTPVLGALSYVIEVFSAGSVRRTVNVGNNLSYTYTVEDAKADGGPFRAYTLRVYAVNQAGQSTTFTDAAFSNPQIGQLQNATIKPMPNSVWFTADRPAEDDYAGIFVWISKTQGFSPDASTLVYTGADTFFVISADADGDPLESGVTYYVRAAAFDTFGTDNLTLTGELSALILSPAIGLLQDDIEFTLLEAGLRDRINLIDTAGDPDFPTGIIDGLRQTNTNLNILDDSANELGQRLLESALKVQENTDLLFDAGVTIDSSTGEVYIFGVREAEDRLDTAEIRLDAAEANINLRATTTFVNEAIAQAVIDPSQIAELGDLQARVGAAEVDIDGLNATVALKADLTTVNDNTARITSAEVDISALQGEIVLKADNTDLSAAEGRITTVEQTLTALDVPTISLSVQDIRAVRRNQDQIAETQLRDILTGEANYKDLDVGIARASLDLRAFTDGRLEAEASARLLLAAELENTSAAIEQESIARATETGAIASQVTTLQSVVGENTTAIQTTQQTVDGVGAKVTVKIDNNGFITGYGLISSDNTDEPISDFVVVADRFSISEASSPFESNPRSPFFVLTSSQTVDGRTLPPGTYLKRGVLGRAIITSAEIDDAAITNATIADAAITEAKITTGAITNALIQNATIDGNAKIANASIGNAKITDLNATKINAGFLDAARIQVGSIDARIASINNAQIASLDAGKINTGTLSADRIAAGSIDAKIANISAAVIGSGTLNIARIANGSITSAKIGDAQITTAKIGTAQIDTLRVAGNAVTVTGATSVTNNGTVSFSLNMATSGRIVIIGFFPGGFTSGTLQIFFNGTLIRTINGRVVQVGEDAFTGNPIFERTSETQVIERSIPAGTTTITAVLSNGLGTATVVGFARLR